MAYVNIPRQESCHAIRTDDRVTPTTARNLVACISCRFHMLILAEREDRRGYGIYQSVLRMALSALWMSPPPEMPAVLGSSGIPSLSLPASALCQSSQFGGYISYTQNASQCMTLRQKLAFK